MLADQRRAAGDSPGRAVIDRGLTRVGDGCGRVRDARPASRSRDHADGGHRASASGRADRAPGEAALLAGVVDFLGRQAGDEAGERLVDDMRCVRRDDRRVLVFRVLQIAGHAITIHQVRQIPDVPGVEAAGNQRSDINAILGPELRPWRRIGRMMAAGLSAQRLAAIDVVGDCGFGGQGTGLVDRCVDKLPASGNGSIDQGSHDRHGRRK